MIEDIENRHDTYGEVYGTTGTSQTVFGFTGEPTDANSLVYLRARYYNPTIGQFPNLDPLETPNRYAYVEGNAPNRVDPSGLFGEKPWRWDTCKALTPTSCSQSVSIYIWASTFIMPPSVTFPDVYSSSPLEVDWSAQWHGDGRNFYTGAAPRFASAANRSARLYHELRFDTDAIQENYQKQIESYAGSGFTYVKYVDDKGNPGIFSGHATAPDPAILVRNGNQILVTIGAAAGDPLVYLPGPNGGTIPFAPNAYYDYNIFFDLETGYYGLFVRHGFFPWYELYVELGGKPLITYQKEPPLNNLLTLGIPLTIKHDQTGVEPSLAVCK